MFISLFSKSCCVRQSQDRCLGETLLQKTTGMTTLPTHPSQIFQILGPPLRPRPKPWIRARGADPTGRFTTKRITRSSAPLFHLCPSRFVFARTCGIVGLYGPVSYHPGSSLPTTDPNLPAINTGLFAMIQIQCRLISRKRQNLKHVLRYRKDPKNNVLQ